MLYGQIPSIMFYNMTASQPAINLATIVNIVISTKSTPGALFFQVFNLISNIFIYTSLKLNVQLVCLVICFLIKYNTSLSVPGTLFHIFNAFLLCKREGFQA